MNLWIRQRGKTLGPLPLDKVLSAYAAGKFASNAEVSDDQVNWRPITDLSRLSAKNDAISVSQPTGGYMAPNSVSAATTPASGASQMGFNFTCPFCNQVMQCEGNWAGMQAQCPSCGRTVLLNPPVTGVSGSMAGVPSQMPGSVGYASTPSTVKTNNNASEGKMSTVFGCGFLIAVVAVLLLLGTCIFGGRGLSRSQIRTSEQLVMKIVQEMYMGDEILKVEIRDVSKVDRNHYKAKASVDYRAKKEGRLKKALFRNIKITVHGKDVTDVNVNEYDYEVF